MKYITTSTILFNYIPITNSPHITPPKLVLQPIDEQLEVIPGILAYTKLSASTFGSAVKACTDYLGLPKITKFINNVEMLVEGIGNIAGHSLANFKDLDKKAIVQTQDWNKTPDGKVVIEGSPEFDGIKSTGTGLITLKISPILDSFQYVELQEFTYKDMTLAGDIQLPAG